MDTNEKHSIDVEQIRSSLETFIEYIRSIAIGLHIEGAEYNVLNRRLATMVAELRNHQEMLTRGLDEKNQREFARVAGNLCAIVQDGCAELVADWHDGMTYEQFRARMEEERRVWDSQLHMPYEYDMIDE